MKVKELIAKLQLLDPELECIIQKDGEGNEYSPLADINANCVYIAETTWCGNVYNATWTAEDADIDEYEWAAILDKPRCVVLFVEN